MTQRRRGRPTGPDRVPFTTTIRPDALARLRERSVETYKTARAVNRVIEEGIMGLAAAKETVSVPAVIYVARDGEEIEVSAVVEIEIERDGSIGDWSVTSATADGHDVKLGEDEAADACEIAHEKYCANRSDYR